MKIITSILLSLGLLNISLYAGDIDLPAANFNFDLKCSSGNLNYKPKASFISRSSTFIKFATSVTAGNLPIILVNSDPGNINPEINYVDGYVVINQPCKSIKIYDPKSKALQYSLYLVDDFDYLSVNPSPNVIAKEYAGHTASIAIGSSNINSMSYNKALSVSVGYNWSLIKGLLSGFTIGADYDGDSSSGDVSASSKNINILFRAMYLYESGLNVSLEFGPTYVRNSESGNGKNANIENGFASYAGFSVGYLFQNRLQTSLGYDHIFSNSNVNPVDKYTMNFTYYFG